MSNFETFNVHLIGAEIAERQAEFAAEKAQWEAEEAAIPPAADWRYWLNEDVNHAISKLNEWVFWHMDRADSAGLPPSGALGEVAECALDLLKTFDETPDDDGAIDAVRQALHDAISEAKWSAEKDLGRASKNREIRRAQSEEIETSFLRSWARQIDNIFEYYKMARDNPERAVEFQVECLRSWAHGGPPRVEHLPENFR
jgi:hypothetical protein